MPKNLSAEPHVERDRKRLKQNDRLGEKDDSMYEYDRVRELRLFDLLIEATLKTHHVLIFIVRSVLSIILFVINSGL